MHCVSVGEFRAAIPLIDKLIINYTDYKIVISTTTTTGADACISHYKNNEVIFHYFPFDVPFIIHRFLRAFNPKISIILETEIWPNWAKICYQKNIKLLLVNARLSEKSFKKYKKFAIFSKKTLAYFDLIATQDEYSYQRFLALGAIKVKLVGNIKFDINIKINKINLNNLKNIIAQREIIIFASTHNNEEQIIINAYKKYNIKQLLVIVPRHPQRFAIVENLLQQNNINYIKRSDNKKCNQQTTVLLIDSMGELLELYHLTNIAFIGGSLVPVGGHNMLEAIACNAMVIFGKNMFNFADISSKLLINNAAIQVNDADDLFIKIILLINNKNTRQYYQNNAANFLIKNTGATNKLMNIITKF